jgi:uncharacterized membrane protein
MIALHNLFDGVTVAPMAGGGATGRDLLISILHVRNPPVIYPLIPWIGVMALGYAAGPIFALEPARRRRTLLLLGLGLSAAFFLLRGINLYGDPHPWTPDHPILGFFNTEKYPPSLDYLLMTLGPLFLLLAAAEKMRSPALVIFGRVPLFFYVAHVYVIHLLALLLGIATGFGVRPFLTGWPWFPKGFGLPLGAVYLAWALVVLALYPACRWFAQLERRES